MLNVENWNLKNPKNIQDLLEAQAKPRGGCAHPRAK